MRATSATAAPGYELDADFERVVLYYACRSPRFWGQVARHLDPAGLELPLSKLIMTTCRQIAKETGHGPESDVLVIQRLQRQVKAGKVESETVVAVLDLFESLELRQLPSADAVANELIPVVRQRMQFDALSAAHMEFARGGDLSGARELLSNAEVLGEQDVSSSSRLATSAFAEIEEAQNVQRLSYGIPELDAELGGGAPRKAMVMYIGDSGGGKSMHLASQAGTNMIEQVFTGFATLELPKHLQLARVLAHLTGVDIDGITDNPVLRREAERRWEILEPQMGLLELGEFSPGATSAQDLLRWVEEKEQEAGQKMEGLVVDYMDKLWDPRVRDMNEYQSQKYVAEGLRRDIAMERDMWVHTASQATRPGKDSKKLLDQGHVADSMHKVRVSDIVITLNPDAEDDSSMVYFVAKNRLGIARRLIGPTLTDFARARASAFTRELGPW